MTDVRDEDGVHAVLPLCSDISSGGGEDIIPTGMMEDRDEEDIWNDGCPYYSSGGGSEIIPIGIGPNRNLDDASEQSKNDPRDVAPTHDDMQNEDREAVIGNDDIIPLPPSGPFGTSRTQKRKVYHLGERQVNTRRFRIKSEKYTDMANVLSTLESTCCKKRQCLSCYRSQDVLTERKMFWAMKQSEQTNFMIEDCKKYSVYAENGDLLHFRFAFLGKTVCSVAFAKLYGLGSQRVAAISNHVKKGISMYYHKRMSRVRSMTVSSAEILSWMQKYFALNTEIMPNSDRYHLADSLTRKAVYELFLLRNRHVYYDTKQPSKQRFLKIWREQCPLICIPSVKRFSVCAQCSLFKASRDRATNKIDRGKTSRLGAILSSLPVIRSINQFTRKYH
jgi:hypothetical protein